MADSKEVPDFQVSIEGSPLPPDWRSLVHAIEVHQSLSLFDMFVLHVDNPDAMISDANVFDQGNTVEIELGYVGKRTKLISGVIVSTEPVWPLGQTPYMVVRGYDKAHALRRGRKRRTFLKQKASDVVSKLASEDGLQADVDDTTLVYEYLMQNN